jgi:RecA-family ATPase
VAELQRLADATPPCIESDNSASVALTRFEEMRPRLSDGYLLKHVLSSGSMAVLYGESGIRKTFLAPHVSLRVVAGSAFLSSPDAPRWRHLYCGRSQALPSSGNA